MESELKLSRGGLPPLSARGCIQTLTPINLGDFHRTLEGKLIYNKANNSKKYKSHIVCQDKSVFASEGLWIGEIVRVSCIQRLFQKINGKHVELEKLPVKGSIKLQTHSKPNFKLNEKNIAFDNECKGFISYQPTLDMRVINIQLQTNEWEIKTQWKLDLEEI